MGISKLQLEPVDEDKYKKKLHYLGQRSKTGLMYLTRNASFEPSAGRKDWTGSCLKEIDVAFKYRKSAVICTHRVNFIGGLNEKNRSNGLEQLKELLRLIQFQWPETWFMSSGQLGDLMVGNKPISTS